MNGTIGPFGQNMSADNGGQKMKYKIIYIDKNQGYAYVLANKKKINNDKFKTTKIPPVSAYTAKRIVQELNKILKER